MVTSNIIDLYVNTSMILSVIVTLCMRREGLMGPASRNNLSRLCCLIFISSEPVFFSF